MMEEWREELKKERKKERKSKKEVKEEENKEGQGSRDARPVQLSLRSETECSKGAKQPA